MRLPWVSRVTYEMVRDNAVAALHDSHEREERQEARIDGLLRQIAELAKPLEPVKLPTRTRDQVIDAIMARAGSNGQIRAHLAAWAQNQRRNQVPDDKIIESILIWASPDEDDPSAGVP